MANDQLHDLRAALSLPAAPRRSLPPLHPPHLHKPLPSLRPHHRTRLRIPALPFLIALSILQPTTNPPLHSLLRHASLLRSAHGLQRRVGDAVERRRGAGPGPAARVRERAVQSAGDAGGLRAGCGGGGGDERYVSLYFLLLSVPFFWVLCGTGDKTDADWCGQTRCARRSRGLRSCLRGMCEISFEKEEGRGRRICRWLPEGFSALYRWWTGQEANLYPLVSSHRHFIPDSIQTFIIITPCQTSPSRV